MAEAGKVSGKIKEFLNSQVNNEENWAVNMLIGNCFSLYLKILTLYSSSCLYLDKCVGYFFTWRKMIKFFFSNLVIHNMLISRSKR
ncbi:hypothetical protein IEQ34_001903 [Dendrobium chrysotoxum]|uniref:Uncharacterized protein n=1 Tax=Dendrobium chrysotoxum TaxID=161865 RepID=A0AAV7HIC6_DENCH|nr:hypothetical protein IEQ34_001903 [Dendrobium chrysotoxum]